MSPVMRPVPDHAADQRGVLGATGLDRDELRDGAAAAGDRDGLSLRGLRCPGVGRKMGLGLGGSDGAGCADRPVG